MISVTVKLFASFREAVGLQELSTALVDGATVRELRDVLVDRYPDLGPLVSSACFAVNREYVEAETILNDGDEVVLLPPLSGG